MTGSGTSIEAIPGYIVKWLLRGPGRYRDHHKREGAYNAGNNGLQYGKKAGVGPDQCRHLGAGSNDAAERVGGEETAPAGEEMMRQARELLELVLKFRT